MLQYNYRFRKRYKFSVRWYVTVAIIVAVVLRIDNCIRPMIKTMAASQAKVFATRIINDAVNKQFSADDISYDALIKVTLDSSGKVTSV